MLKFSCIVKVSYIYLTIFKASDKYDEGDFSRSSILSWLYSLPKFVKNQGCAKQQQPAKLNQKVKPKQKQNEFLNCVVSLL